MELGFFLLHRAQAPVLPGHSRIGLPLPALPFLPIGLESGSLQDLRYGCQRQLHILRDRANAFPFPSLKAIDHLLLLRGRDRFPGMISAAGCQNFAHGGSMQAADIEANPGEAALAFIP